MNQELIDQVNSIFLKGLNQLAIELKLLEDIAQEQQPRCVLDIPADELTDFQKFLMQKMASELVEALAEEIKDRGE